MRFDAQLPGIVVMGVSASGKTSVAAELARLLRRSMIDADDLHPAANVAKMAAGRPLDDSDRWPWLDAVADRLAAPERPVVACSALKRSYRDRLRVAAPNLVFIHLTGSPELLVERAVDRRGHFMPPSLLRSQFDALEMLQPDEMGVEFDVAASVDDIAHDARDWVSGFVRTSVNGVVSCVPREQEREQLQ